jgi:hypothetical protein
MKVKYLLTLFCIITALAFIIAYTIEPPATHSGEQYSGTSTTSVLNQNTLNVVFPGQNLTIRTENDSNQRICYSIYEDAWLPEKHRRLQEGVCYDFERNAAGICDSDSDLEIKDGKITPLNGAVMLVIEYFNDTEFLCSNTVLRTFYDRYKEELCYNTHNPEECCNAVGVNVYTDARITHFATLARRACIITSAGNHFKYEIENYEIEQKQERIPSDMVCTEADDGSIVVETSVLGNGVHHIAYASETSSGKREETGTYTFVKTGVPYSHISNPNFISIIYPENKEEWNGFYIFSEFLISAEYTEDLTAIWYRCDKGEWHRAEAEGKFAYVRIDESLCKTPGKHTIFYFAESSGLNGTMNKDEFFQNTERPSTENPSIITERTGNTYTLEAQYEFNSPAGLPNVLAIVEWHENGSIIGYEKSIEVPGGSSITARITSVDVTRLLGNPVNISTNVPNEPPEASDINISFHFRYPPVILATGEYQDPDSTKEGQSIYRWYRDGILINEGRELVMDLFSLGMTVEYTPVDVTGLPGHPFSMTISDQALIDSWLYTFALYQSNLTYCERISNESLRSECHQIVDLAVRECGNRQVREKFFCLAFLKNDPEYCRYIDAEWYMINCMVLILGSPEGCMELDEDNRDSCMLEFASSTGNQGLCTNITNPDTRTLCTALANKNPDICYSISDPSLRERCVSDASYR